MHGMWPEGLKTYMVGIGGSGMSSLAVFLHESGVSVSGSDASSTRILADLEERGIRILPRRHDGGSLPQGLDFLVHTAAVDASEPEVARAQEQGLEVLKYSQMLGRLMNRLKGVAVAGSHGKTSVSALSAYLLRAAGMSPSFVFGGDAPDLGGGGGRGDGDVFIAEACEFDRSFLNLKPRFAIVTNLEPDHLDFYGTFGRLTEAFLEFLSGIAEHRGSLVIWDEAARILRPSRFEGLDISTYGYGRECDLRISHVRSLKDGTGFRLAAEGRDLGEWISRQPGRHSVLNAAAACLFALKIGVSPGLLKEALPRFRGIRRRLESKGALGGVEVFSDYAHHPTEIKAVLDTLRERFPSSRLVVAYQGHQKWRTGYFMKSMGEVLAGFDLALILKTFSVREKDTRGLPGARDLCEQVIASGGASCYVGALDEAPYAIVPHLEKDDVLVLMGAGSIDEISGIVEEKLSLRGRGFDAGEDHGGDRGAGAASA